MRTKYVFQYDSAIETEIYMLVSVIITTKNREHLLPRAVESVLSQTHKEIELIVVDDGSTKPVTLNYSDPRLRVLRNDLCVGLPEARNRGFRAAQGKYFAMLDDDDFYFPEKIASQVAYLESHPDIDLVFGRVAVEDADKNRRYYLGADHVHNSDINLRAFNLIHPAAAMFKREVFDRIPFNTDLKKYEDTLFFIQICQTFQTAYDPIDTAVWMQDGRPDQLTRVYFKRNFDNFRIVCRELAPFVDVDRGLRRLYYGRLGFQAIRCFRLDVAICALFKAV